MRPSTPAVDEARHVGRVVDGPRQHVRARARALRAMRSGVSVAPERRPDGAARRLRRASAPSRRSARASRPACHGDGASPSRFTVSLFAVSIVRHAVAISGASFFTSTSVRQSNDCTRRRAPRSRRRESRRRRAARTSPGSSVSSPLRRRDLGLEVEAHGLAAAPHEREELVPASGTRSPSAGCCSGNCLRVAARRIEAADVVARAARRASASGSAAPWPSSHLPSAPRTRSGLSNGSCDDDDARRRCVTARSVSSVVTPIVERALERGERVLGREAARAAMPLRGRTRRLASAAARSRPRAHGQPRDFSARSHARHPRMRRAPRGLTTNSGRRPASASTMLVRPVDAMLWKHSSVQHSECGVTITLSIASSGLCGIDRLLLEHVERGAGDAPAAQRLDQRGLVDDRPARHVDEVRGRLHPRELRRADRCRVASLSRRHRRRRSPTRAAACRGRPCARRGSRARPR